MPQTGCEGTSAIIAEGGAPHGTSDGARDRKYGQKKPYTNQQKINRGLGDKKKKYTTCRLMKRLKSRTTGRQACVYRGGNKTYTLMYEDNCPAQYRCVYNPWSKEPNIDDIVDSLNSIKKGNK